MYRPWPTDYSVSAMTRPLPSLDDALRELMRLYAEADALVAGLSCTCTDARDREGALCCHFANIGREPYVTEIEVELLRRALAARAGRAARAGTGAGAGRRRLPLADDARTCPLLSPVGRCIVYDARPLGCRSFFCDGEGGTRSSRRDRAPRKPLQDLARRIAALSEQALARPAAPRLLTRALGTLSPSGRPRP